jgi:hypothetical protein
MPYIVKRINIQGKREKKKTILAISGEYPVLALPVR